jgi:hypothetical protein
MRDNIGLNTRQKKFVQICAAHPELSTVECFVRAGYAGRDSANASALKKRLHEHIELERARLGYAPGEEPAAVDDSELEAALVLARATHAMAVGAGDVKSAVKATKTIADILRKKGKPGRPAAAKPATPAQRENRFAHLSAPAIVSMVLSAEEIADIDARYAAVEEGRAAWLRGETSSLEHLRYLPASEQLETLIVGGEEPGQSRADLKSTASPIALDAGEIVRRL